jgi:hypothetical protein
MKGKPEFRGKPKQLNDQLAFVLPKEQAEDLPSPVWLSREYLDRAKGLLLKVHGLEVTTGVRFSDNVKNGIIIERVDDEEDTA